MQALLHRFPTVTLGEAALMAKLEQLGINYDNDIRPLFGNPVVVGVATSSAPAPELSFLVVWVTKDAGKLNALIKKIRRACRGRHP